MLMKLYFCMGICFSSRFISIVLWPRMTHQDNLKMCLVGEGPGAILWVLRHFLPLITRLLVAISEWAMVPHSSTLGLENPMDRGAWWAAVHGIAEGWTQLSDFTFTFHFHALEKEMATHSSVFAWRIPGTGEPAGLPSMGSHRVGHDWSDLAAAAAAAT